MYWRIEKTPSGVVGSAVLVGSVTGQSEIIKMIHIDGSDLRR